MMKLLLSETVNLKTTTKNKTKTDNKFNNPESNDIPIAKGITKRDLIASSPFCL